MRKLGILINPKGRFAYIVIIIIVLALSIFSAYSISVYGKIGVIPAVVAIGAFFVYAALRLPRFGVIMLMVMSYFIMYVIALFPSNFPLGTLMDGILALLTLGFFMQQKYYTNFKVFNEPISYLILIWIIYNLLQVFNPNAASQLAWVYTIRGVAVVMLSYFIFTYYIISTKFLRTIIIVWLSMAVFAALYAMKQEYIGFFPFEEANHYDPLVQSLLFIDGHWRKNSIFSDPVAFSYNMAVASLLCIGLMTGPYKMKYKVLLGFLAAMFAFVMTYSGTRGSYVLIPAAVFLFLIIRLNKSLIMLGIVAGIGLYVLINIPTSNVTLYRFQSAFKPNSDASYKVRKATQKEIQPFIQSHPIGGGLGGSGVWGVRFAPNSYLAQFPPDSGYVRVAMELGWVGLLIICTIMFASLYIGIKNYFSIRDPELRSICLAMVIIVFAISIANFPQEAIVQYPMSVFFYLFLALIRVTKVLDDKKYAEENNIQKKVIKVIE